MPELIIDVPAEGRKDCIMALVGEAPGKNELLYKTPFCGQSGDLLNRSLHICGIARQACYITNLVKRGLPRNDFGEMWIGNIPSQELGQWREALLKELDELETNIVVALGANALWALTGEKAITKWRGSLSLITLPSGRKMKVMGTYHPAAVLRQWDWKAAFEFDLIRAKEESSTSELELPQREYIIKPSYSDVVNFGQDTERKELSYDIETAPGRITCISFAYDKDKAISIPTTKEYWGDMETLHNILKLVETRLHEPGVVKIGQNITFDIQYLARFFNILPTKPWFDTMIAQHACYSEMPKALAFLTSIYTKEPYYKDELKIWQGKMSDMEMLWTYNAKDAAVTLEVKHALEEEMEDLGVRHTYDYMMELLEPLLCMMLRGAKTDPATIIEHNLTYKKSLEEREIRFNEKFPGVNPHSPAQVKYLAYTTLKLKPVMLHKKPTVNKDALEKLSITNPDIAEVIGIRRDRKMLSTYIEVPTDEVDGRMKFSLNSTGAETGRLSSSASVFGSGTNLQNWPKSLRNIIVPNSNDLEFTQADLKGAESMVVMYLCGDEMGIKMLADGKNIHINNARILWPDKSEQDILDDKEQGKIENRDPMTIMYDKAKRIEHGCNYLMSWVALQKVIKCSAAEAKMLIARFLMHKPNLGLWHKEVEHEITTTRTMVTPLGRKRIFYGRFGPELFREATAYVPQETVAHVLNIGLIRVYNKLCNHPQVNLINQVHDSILLEHPKSMREEIHSQLPNLMRVDLTIKGRQFYIPTELEVGDNWRDMKDA